MIAPSALRLPLCLALSAAFARADVAWLDFQGSPDAPAGSHQTFQAIDGASVTDGAVTFTLSGKGIGARSRKHDDEMLKDFAFVDGPGATLTLRIAGLPAGTYAVESWHFDLDYPGAVQVGFSRRGETPSVLVPHHLFAASPAIYSITSDGASDYELTFRENDDNNRVRLNGLRIRLADAPSGAPGTGFKLNPPAPAVATTPLLQSLPGDAVAIAPDGAWTWFNDERAIVHDGRLYVGYVNADGMAGLSRYDLATGQASQTKLGTPASSQRDDHNNPSLTVLPDGRLLALYSKHLAGGQYYQRTSLVPNPASAADWGPEIVRRTPASNTYANTYRLSAENNRIYNFHRCINFNPTLTISEDLGATWLPSRQLIKSGAGGIRPYTRLSSNHRDRIDAIYTDGHPRDIANSLYHLYYKEGAFRRTDGTVIKSADAIPIDHDSGERGSVIYSYHAESWSPGQGPDDWIPTGRAWNWDVHQDRDGNPVVAFQVQRDDVTGKGWNHDRIFYYYARWTGSEWQRRFIAHAGRPLYAAEDDYGGGMALDPTDPRVVYISSNAADPFKLSDTTDIPLRAKERYEIWRGFTADGGLTFTWTQITVNSPADNIRPIVPENHGRTECLLWVYGSYGTYSNYSTRILGRLGKPVASVSVAPAASSTNTAPTTVGRDSTPISPDAAPARKSPTQRNPVRR